MRCEPESANHRMLVRPLTSTGLIALEYVAPPAHMAPYITTFYLLRCEEARITDVLPGGLGIVSVFMKGQGQLFVRDGTVDRGELANVLTPLSAAAPIEVEGPWHAFGASLSPLGWAALSGRRSAAEHGNRLLPAATLLDTDFAATARELADGWNTGDLGTDEMAGLLGSAIEVRLKPVPEAHAKLIATVAEWLSESLSPRVDRLQERVLYSPRQLQRLVDHYYGLPPKQLARKYRALRSAGLLADPATTEQQVAMIAAQFQDHSHMAREITLFAGRAPARIGGGEHAMLTALLDLRNFREIKPAPNLTNGA